MVRIAGDALKRRDTTRVLHDILTLADRGIPKTRIVYLANLNYKQAQPYFAFLLTKGHLTRDHPSQEGPLIYKLTSKGVRLLRLLRNVQTELDALFSADSGLSSIHSRTKRTRIISTSLPRV